MSGAELAKEMEARKGCKPNPGTIYPALKELLRKKAVKVHAQKGKEKIYALTPMGREQSDAAACAFCKVFYDVFTR